MMKQLKKPGQIPSDYQILLHLSDIQHWKKLHRTIAEAEIRFNGFYACVYDDKKILVVR